MGQYIYPNNEAIFSGGTVAGDTNFQGSMSAATLYSGLTNLDSLFSHVGHTHEFASILNTAHTHFINDISNLQSFLDSKLNVSGGTMTGGLFIPTLSAATLYSGSSNIGNMFLTSGISIGSGLSLVNTNIGNFIAIKSLVQGSNISLTNNGNDITISTSGIRGVSPGINTFTGDSSNGNQTINVTALTISNLNVSGETYLQSISAATYYSGSTLLSDLIGQKLFVGTGGSNIIQNYGAGAYNTAIYGSYNILLQTQNVTISGNINFITGRFNTALTSSYINILGGSGNITENSNNTTVLGGVSNITNTVNISTIGGKYNQIKNLNYGLILNGKYNKILNSYNTSIFNGYMNSISGNSTYSTVNNGKRNLIRNVSTFTTIDNGYLNRFNSGTYSSIINGRSNTGSSKYTVIVNGTNNLSVGDFSFIGNGFDNRNTTGVTKYSILLNGRENRISQSIHYLTSFPVLTNFGTIINGFSNHVLFNYSTVLNGSDNHANGFFNLILNGLDNKTNNNHAQQTATTIINGIDNSAKGNYATIINGNLNKIDTTFGFIGNGFFNQVPSQGYFGTILNGKFNNTQGGYFNQIFNGYTNRILGVSIRYNSIGNGKYNNISNNTSGTTILGGSFNSAQTSYGLVASGKFNNIIQGNYNVILGGVRNRLLLNNLGFNTVLNGVDSIIGASISGSTILGSYNLTATTSNTAYGDFMQLRSLTGASTQMVVANSVGQLSVQSIPSAGQSTQVLNGLNTYTGGTSLAVSVNISSVTLSSLSVSGNSTVQSLTATTISSGGTNIGNLFSPTGHTHSFSQITNTAHTHSISEIINLQSNLDTKVNKSGDTMTGGLITTSLTANTLNIRSLSGGGTLMVVTDNNGVISSQSIPSAGQSTQVLNGLNIYTGGTSLAVSLNISSVTLSSLSVSGNSTVQSLTATTISSGGTNIGNLFSPTGHTHTFAQITNTAHTHSISEIINLQSNLDTKVNKSGDTMTGSLITTSLTANTLNVRSLSGGGTLMVVTDNNGVISSQSIPSAGQSTQVLNGLNTYTGGTSLAVSVNISSVTLSSLSVSGNSTVQSLTATTISSGGTNIGNLFSPTGHTHQFSTILNTAHTHSISEIINLQSNLDTKVNKSGDTMTGSLITTSLTANTLNIRSLSGGGTLMVVTDNNGVISSQSIPSAGQSTQVLNGLNTYTGGTSLAVSINISSVTLSSLSVSGNSTVQSLTATTISSGGTNIGNLFSPTGHTHSFSQITNTAHTHSISEVVNLQSNLDTKVNKSGDTMTGGLTTTSLSATTISGGTINSGSTNIGNLFSPTGHTHTLAQLTNTAHTHSISEIINLQSNLDTKVNKSGDTMTGLLTTPFLSATTISGGTINSGSTNIGNLFSPTGHTHTFAQLTNTAHTHSISEVINLQSNLDTKVNKSGDTMTGGLTTPSLSATTFSAGTINSGSTNIGNLFSPVGHTHSFSQLTNTAHTHSISEIINLQSNLDTKLNKSGDTMTGGLTTPSLSATTFSGGTIQSNSLIGGSTQMVVANTNGILSTQAIPSAGQSTQVLSGLNTYTGGTALAVSVNVSSLTINTLSASGNSIVSANFSANTMFSGSTEIGSLFGEKNTASNIGPGSGLFVQKSNNDLQFKGLSAGTNISFSVNSNTISISSSGGVGSSTLISNGLNTYTGGTALNPSINISAATLTSISATTLSGGTIFSGNTNLNNLFAPNTHTHPGGIGFTIDAGSSTITTGLKGYVIVPYSGTIISWTILSDISGSIVIDVWKDSYANYPPSVSDSIAGTEKITLSLQQKNQDVSLTTWNTIISPGDILAFNVDSVSTVKKVTVILSLLRS